MADRGQHRTGGITDSVKSILSDRGPTKTQALAVATLFPTGGILLSLSGLVLAASVVGFGLLAPIFLLFSPVLVPAALLMGFAVTGFLTSGQCLDTHFSRKCSVPTLKKCLNQLPSGARLLSFDYVVPDHNSLHACQLPDKKRTKLKYDQYIYSGLCY